MPFLPNLNRQAFLSGLSPLLVGLMVAAAVSASWAQSPSLPPVTATETVVDPTTLEGKVLCGYQGWFACEGDGSGLGWVHWNRNRSRPPRPGDVTVDLWPDVSELGPDERFKTDFKAADGSVAEVFSSFNRKTVIRHFQWMREYGIDGVFVQRFANGLTHPLLKRHKDSVLEYCREGAQRNGRVFSVMYDLSGLNAGEVSRVREDWSRLLQDQQIADATGYLHHQGRPLVAVWGIGFNDNRNYGLQECKDLVEFLKSGEAGTPCAVMVGVPSWWREGVRDALKDPLLKEITDLADVVSPWSVGRYRSPDEAVRHAKSVWEPDLEWCRSRGTKFLPVVFPGFSWHNLKGDRLNAIPRLEGRFLWSQFRAAQEIGARMVYVAMFDEVDEGTAIFKCTDNIPVGEGVSFLGMEGVPSDHYLRLTGRAAQRIRMGIPLEEYPPTR